MLIPTLNSQYPSFSHTNYIFILFYLISRRCLKVFKVDKFADIFIYLSTLHIYTYLLISDRSLNKIWAIDRENAFACPRCFRDSRCSFLSMWTRLNEASWRSRRRDNAWCPRLGRRPLIPLRHSNTCRSDNSARHLYEVQASMRVGYSTRIFASEFHDWSKAIRAHKSVCDKVGWVKCWYYFNKFVREIHFHKKLNKHTNKLINK